MWGRCYSAYVVGGGGGRLVGGAPVFLSMAARAEGAGMSSEVVDTEFQGPLMEGWDVAMLPASARLSRGPACSSVSASVAMAELSPGVSCVPAAPAGLPAGGLTMARADALAVLGAAPEDGLHVTRTHDCAIVLVTLAQLRA